MVHVLPFQISAYGLSTLVPPTATQ